MKCPKCGRETVIIVPIKGCLRGYTFGCLLCGWMKKNRRN